MSRIFAAVAIPSEVELHLAEATDGVRGSRPELRWVPSSRWHLTAEFIGECGPHELDRQLERWGRRARRSRPHRLRLAGAGAFPHTWRARVLWVGLAGDVDIWTRLARYGQDPHVTLARTRREALDLTGPVTELERYSGPTWTVTEVSVIESHLRPAGARGPRYTVLETFPLGPQP